MLVLVLVLLVSVAGVGIGVGLGVGLGLPGRGAIRPLNLKLVSRSYTRVGDARRCAFMMHIHEVKAMNCNQQTQ